MECPFCGEDKLDVIDDDKRQEWEKITYSCKYCGTEPVREITFKTQSSMIESDGWHETKKKCPICKQKFIAYDSETKICWDCLSEILSRIER